MKRLLNEVLAEVQSPPDMATITQEIALPVLPEIALDHSGAQEKDLFAAVDRKAWDKSMEARCDFQYHLRMTRRASTSFISIWQKSVFGRTLTDIKGDDSMVPFFAEHLMPVIQEVIGFNLSQGDWALVTTPMRRHRVHNFASRIAEQLAAGLGVPFYFECAHCRSKQRVNAVFDAYNIPRERNVIVFDDFVTTGSTLLAMKNLLVKEGRNPIFFCGINNKL